ncbi:DUF4177 domain-containing protein [Jannaschia sp. S6380]|uniref:DUF4177 domain-containing protein n=1 Tax=Jannaschia sp. S6380 TaxID=2926408 RepID=UPI001FF6E7A4|nr:DUF4177 domain-containing protein [Jannaschia sp. S6380]MCK0167302.1 DUF4177 domain-containing protein [Jannaschia sp. S6380]
MRHDPTQSSVIYEYEVIPAPTKPERQPGLKTDGERIAFMLSEIFNELAEEGWEYVRADTINIDNVTGIAGNAPKGHTLLVFRRPLTLPAPRQSSDALVPDNRVA